MNDRANEPDRTPDIDRESLLLHRALERVATEQEWTEIEGLAARDPGVYRRLAALLRDETALTRWCDEAIATLDTDASPAVAPSAAPRSHPAPLRHAGWLAAAAMFLAWVATAMRESTHSSSELAAPTLRRGEESVAPRFSPRGDENAIVRVLDDGATTQSELSRTLVDAKRAEDGWDLLYLCRSFERVRVPELEGTLLDDAGSPRVVPITFSDPSEWREF